MNKIKIEKCIKIMEEIYGKYNNSSWIPKPYKEGKGRYLWTDAFGVCNFVNLFYETGNEIYLEQAKLLIKNVHDILGKDRTLKKRLNGATEENPLLGGLRIGKEDPEGTPDGDGQYFHYLTKWMFALNRVSIATKNLKYNNWAIELAKSIHPKFVYNRNTNEPRMYWKMSIDLSKPHVYSEGNLDSYDGYITYRLLRELSNDKLTLENEINDMYKMVNNRYKHYYSDDPLDLGEAIWISHWFPNEIWSQNLFEKSLSSLEKLYKIGYFHTPFYKRLAFREFGTTIGIQCHPKINQEWIQRSNDLNDFWENYLFIRDKDITPVMFCSSLIPGVWNQNYQKLKS